MQLSMDKRKRGGSVSVNNQQADNGGATSSIDTFFTVGELAEFLKVHHTTVYRLVKRQDLPAFKVGSDWRFSKKAIEKWLAARQKQGKKTSDH